MRALALCIYNLPAVTVGLQRGAATHGGSWSQGGLAVVAQGGLGKLLTSRKWEAFHLNVGFNCKRLCHLCTGEDCL